MAVVFCCRRRDDHSLNEAAQVKPYRANSHIVIRGRQPWLVYGVLTTAQAAAPVPTPTIALTLSIYLMLYLALTAAYVAAVFGLARKGPGAEPSPQAAGALRPQRHVRPA